jgi:hypothetical protein
MGVRGSMRVMSLGGRRRRVRGRGVGAHVLLALALVLGRDQERWCVDIVGWRLIGRRGGGVRGGN